MNIIKYNINNKKVKYKNFKGKDKKINKSNKL